MCDRNRGDVDIYMEKRAIFERELYRDVYIDVVLFNVRSVSIRATERII